MNIIQTLDVMRNSTFITSSITELYSNGVKGVRFNFGRVQDDALLRTLEETISIVAAIELDMDYLFDLPFPKRKSRIVGLSIEDNYVCVGHEYIVTFDTAIFHACSNSILVEQIDVVNAKPGQVLFYGDGENGFEIIEQNNTSSLRVVALSSGMLRLTKALNWGFAFPAATIQSKVMQQISLVPNAMVAFSFVETQTDIASCSQRQNGHINIAKIETKPGVVSVDNILQVVDGIMVARGDLGINIPINDFYRTVKRLVEKTLNEKKRVLYATDILTSLENQYFPSRADIMDVGLSQEMGCTDVVLPFRNDMISVISMLKKIIGRDD